MNPTPRKPAGTRELLDPTGTPNLYRHRVNDTYYGIKKVAGRRHVHSLDTMHRVTANNLLREWIISLESLSGDHADLTLARLGVKFLAGRAGRSESTRKTDARCWQNFQSTFPRKMETLVADVRHSDIATWLAGIQMGNRLAGGSRRDAKRRAKESLRHSSFNRVRLFARQLFEIAEADGAVKKSPFLDHLIKPLTPQQVERLLPDEDEFVAIVAEIRVPSWHHVKGTRGGQRPLRQDESADFIEFLGRAGVGQAEASGLEWKHVGDKHIAFTRRKTGKGFSVLINSQVRELLDRRRLAAGGAQAEGKVFSIRDGKKALSHAIARLGLRNYTQRNLRSFKIVSMIEDGLAVKFIAEQQGHGDGGVLIQRTYSDVIRKNQQAFEDDQLKKMEIGVAARTQAGAKVLPFTAAA